MLSWLIIVFAFFKFTYVGQGKRVHPQDEVSVQPERPFAAGTAGKPEDVVSTYLAKRPFGGGIGHAGVKAKAYLPGSFLSKIATDNWYVLIWAEQGIVGLLLHLFILFLYPF